MNNPEQRPLFSVGERVKLVSERFPEHNGIYHVSNIVYHQQVYEDKFLGPVRQVYDEGGDFGYTLQELEVPEINKQGNAVEIKWCESALRKIYDSGEYSFDELMNVLKSPIAENIQ